MVAVAIALVAVVFSVGAYVGYRTLWDRVDLDEFTGSFERLEEAIDRIELVTRVMSADLITAREQAELVAANLADSESRADLITGGMPGEAADAGAQSGNGNGKT